MGVTAFCGTPEYLAPELLVGNGYTKAVDWWTLGVLLYEMLTGLPPFYDENTNVMYRKILQEPLSFPGPEVVPPAARDLLSRLLERDPQARLGASGAAEIKSHHFFANIDWRKLLQRKYEPSFRPNVVCSKFSFISVFPQNEVADLHRWMPVTPPISTVSSLKKLLKIHTWMVPFFLKPCNNNSKAGLTTVQLLVSEMLVVVSRTRLLEVFRSKQPNEDVDRSIGFKNFFFLCRRSCLIPSSFVHSPFCFDDTAHRGYGLCFFFFFFAFRL